MVSPVFSRPIPPPPPSEEGGVKHDQGKLRYDLIPWEHEEGLAQVFTMGSVKYGDRNWQLGIEEDRLLAAARRHMAAHQRGELDDPESGLDHMYHAAWNLLAIAWNRRNP